jgi:transcription antitermination factor NusG
LKLSAAGSRQPKYVGGDQGLVSLDFEERFYCKSQGEAMSQKAWYAIYTRHQHEKSATQVLATKGLDAFLPLYTTTHQWTDRKKEGSVPLFPCYVFINGELTRTTDILKTPGVIGFVSHAGRPAIIPSEQIEAVRQVVLRSRVEPHPFLNTGDTVRVRTGSLAGVEGILVRKKNSCRLVISVDILGQSVATEIDASLIERVRRAA